MSDSATWLLNTHVLRAKNGNMDSVEHPLDWWAYGGYPAVMRELGCEKSHARRQVHQKIREYYKRTGGSIWKPIGNRGYSRLRRAIMENRAINNELT